MMLSDVCLSIDSPPMTSCQGLKWGRVARVGDPAFAGSITGDCLLSCSSKLHKWVGHASKLAIFRSKINNKNFFGRGHSTWECGRDPASFLDHFKHCFLLKFLNNHGIISVINGDFSRKSRIFPTHPPCILRPAECVPLGIGYRRSG